MRRLPVMQWMLTKTTVSTTSMLQSTSALLYSSKTGLQDLIQKHPTLSRLLERHIDQQRAANTLDGHNEKGQKFHELVQFWIVCADLGKTE